MDDMASIREAVPLYVTLLVFGGHLGLPIFVATMLLSSKVKRHGSLINFCTTWIIYSLVYCLTIYEGHWQSQNTQSLACRTQAVLVHGVAPLSATGACILYAHILIGLLASRKPTPRYANLKLQSVCYPLIFVAPYMVFLVFTIWSISIATKNPELIVSAIYYCTLDYKPITLAVPAFTATCLAVVLITQSAITLFLISRWKVLEQDRIINYRQLSLIARTAIFSLYSCVTLWAAIAFVLNEDSFWSFLVQASPPTTIFLIFCLRRDVFEAWRIWPLLRYKWNKGSSAIQATSPKINNGRSPIPELFFDGSESPSCNETIEDGDDKDFLPAVSSV